MIVQCCMCKQVRKGKTWSFPRAGDLQDGHVSHGYCPTCAAKAFEDLHGLVGSKRLVASRMATS